MRLTFSICYIGHLRDVCCEGLSKNVFFLLLNQFKWFFLLCCFSKLTFENYPGVFKIILLFRTLLTRLFINFIIFDKILELFLLFLITNSQEILIKHSLGCSLFLLFFINWHPNSLFWIKNIPNHFSYSF